MDESRATITNVLYELTDLLEDGHPVDKAIDRVKKHPKSHKAWRHLHKAAKKHKKRIKVKHDGKDQEVQRVYVYPYPRLGFFGGGFAPLGNFGHHIAPTINIINKDDDDDDDHAPSGGPPAPGASPPPGGGADGGAPDAGTGGGTPGGGGP